MKYIGNVISKEGLKIDDERIEAISKIPRPTTVTQVRSFLGMTGYLRKFIPHYSEISRPLVDLTRKRAIFQWSPEKEKAFQSLKSILKSNKVLKLFDVNQTSYLFTDASDRFFGGILMQKSESGDLQPVFYISHQFNSAQRKYSTIEKELYAIFFCLMRLKPMLFCPRNKTICYTDHKPLTTIDATTSNSQIQRWLLAMEEFNVEIKYIKRKI